MMKWSLMPDISGEVIKHQDGSWSELLEQLSTAVGFPNKSACPLIKLASFGDIRRISRSLRHNDNVKAIYGLEGDYDSEDVTLNQALKMLESFDIKAAVYPSPSSTNESPRWRVIAPLSRPHEPEQRAALMARLNGVLGGILAPESFVLTQAYYFGGTPTNQYLVCPTFNDPEKGNYIDDQHYLEKIAIGKETKKSNNRSLSASLITNVSISTVRDLRSALTAINADEYSLWIDIGHALKTIGNQGRSLWLEWSQTSAKYDPIEAANKWDGFNPTSTSYKVVFSKAQSMGWVNLRSLGTNLSGSLMADHVVDIETLEEQFHLLKPVEVNDVIKNPSPPPEFIWDGYLPRGVVSLFAAHGGTGKSTVALMLGVCTALGRPLFGVSTVQCKVLFVSLEDNVGIVRHRLATICRLWNIDPLEIDDKLHIVDGTENPELFSANGRLEGSTTATYFEMQKIVQLKNIGLVLVDNASDAYGGDEIQRRQVRSFMRSLVGVARSTDCAVMLLSHVDKDTSKAKTSKGGEGYSGSTAWHNSARSRMYMTRGTDDLLTLDHQKSNFGRCHEPLILDWPIGDLPQLIRQTDITGLINSVFSSADEVRTKKVLEMIAEFEDREQYCGSSSQARNNVYATLSSEPSFKKLKIGKLDCRYIINQSQRNKWLEIIEYTDHYRKPRQRWTVTSSGRSYSGFSAPSAPCEQLRGGDAHDA